MKEINVTVPTGIGDIFWVHQKLSPYYDRINYTVIGSHWDKIRERSLPFVRLWEGVGTVDSKIVNQVEYDFLINQTPPLWPFINNNISAIHYCCNAALNAGCRLENIDPDLVVKWQVDITTEPVLRPDQYLLLYISGSVTDNRVWRVEQWVEAVRLLQERLGNLPLVLIGAQYDRETQRRFQSLMPVHAWHIDLEAAKVCDLLKHCSFFFSYQSGLGILAENFDRRQLMGYFHYPELWNAWPKRESIARGRYQAFGFGEQPADVIGRVK